MNITRNPAREAELIGQMQASFGDNAREGVHLSDLLNPRRSYWQRVLPMAPNKAAVLYWVAGRGHEDALGRIANLVVTEQRFMHGISFRPDFQWESDPTEFKTRRRNLPALGEEAVVYDSYLDQLRGYAALQKTLRGRLVVFSLLEKVNPNDPKSPSEPELAVYDVTFTEQDIAEEEARLLSRRDGFMNALIGWSMEQLGAALGGRLPVPVATGHAALPLCKEWLCGKPRKVVDTKPFCRTCDKDFATEWGIDKHTSSKSGAGHDVVHEQFHFEYEVRCPYYVFCQPQKTDPTRGAWTKEAA